jgi:hypothetical protein
MGSQKVGAFCLLSMAYLKNAYWLLSVVCLLSECVLPAD